MFSPWKSPSGAMVKAKDEDDEEIGDSDEDVEVEEDIVSDRKTTPAKEKKKKPIVHMG